MHILFVCSGNICRSPSAELVLRARDKKGEFPCASRGTEAFHIGERIDSRAAAALHARGIASAEVRARQIMPEDFSTYDVILGMAREHVRFLRAHRPHESKSRIALFLDSVAEWRGTDVADPYYGELNEFGGVLDSIERGIEGWMARWREGEGEGADDSSDYS